MDAIGSIITVILVLSCGAPAESLLNEFQEKGFATTLLDDKTLMLVGEESLFASEFDVEIAHNENGGAYFKEKTAESASLESIPSKYQQFIEKMEIEQPLEYGPGNFH